MMLTAISRSNTGTRQITLVKHPCGWSVPTWMMAWKYQLGCAGGAIDGGSECEIV